MRDGRLQRRKLAIGAEDVELGVVLPELGAFELRIAHAVAVLVLAVHQELDDLAQLGFVVGEVLLHAHGAAAIASSARSDPPAASVSAMYFSAAS